MPRGFVKSSGSRYESYEFQHRNHVLNENMEAMREQDVQMYREMDEARKKDRKS